MFLRRFKYLLTLLSLTLVVLISGFNINNNNYRSESKDYAPNANNSDTSNWPKRFGIGRAATPADIAAIDISISPDGRGLPAGSGNVVSGKSIYEIKCVSCHGRNGTEGPFSPLVGAMGDSAKAKTIGNYWPYATTLFDYIRRAMPYNMPGSLKDNEVYSLTAYLLYKNRIITAATVINAGSLLKIKMPAKELFVDDDRQGGPEIR